MIMRLVIITQHVEQRSLGKAYLRGSEYVVAHLTREELIRLNAQDIARRVAQSRERIETDQEAIIDWILVDEDEFTYTEKVQIEKHGKITRPVKDLTNYKGD